MNFTQARKTNQQVCWAHLSVRCSLRLSKSVRVYYWGRGRKWLSECQTLKQMPFSHNTSV